MASHRTGGTSFRLARESPPQILVGSARDECGTIDFAAEELKRYVGRILSVDLDCFQQPSAARIVIETNQEA